MAKTKDIREMAVYISALNEPLLKRANQALLRAVANAEAEAKRNVVKNFKGTKDRPKSGQLSAAVFSGFEFKRDGTEGFVGVRSKKGNSGTKPYGRIQEYGGKVLPRFAKNLWLPLFGPKTTGTKGKFKNLTPKGFMNLLIKSKREGEHRVRFKGKRKKGFQGALGMRTTMQKRGTFAILESKSGERMAWFIEKVGQGRSAREKFHALFLLRQQVTIHARPYVGPAVEKAWANLPGQIKADLERRSLES